MDNNKIDFEKIIPDSRKNVENIFIKLKVICKLAYWTGSFPVKGINSSRSFEDFISIKWSLRFIFRSS